MTELQKLMRITPQCEAIVGRHRCAKNASVHVELSNPKPLGRADLCQKHSVTIIENARKAGYELKITDWTSKV